jgi:hypothetical protein
MTHLTKRPTGWSNQPHHVSGLPERNMSNEGATQHSPCSPHTASLPCAWLCTQPGLGQHTCASMPGEQHAMWWWDGFHSVTWEICCWSEQAAVVLGVLG